MKNFCTALFLCATVFFLTSCQKAGGERKGKRTFLSQQNSTILPPGSTPDNPAEESLDSDPLPSFDRTANPLTAMDAGVCESWPQPNVTTDTKWSTLPCAAGKKAYCYKLTVPFKESTAAAKSHQYINTVGTKVMIIYDSSSGVRSVQVEVCSANLPAEAGYITVSGDSDSDAIGTSLSVIFKRVDGKSISQNLKLNSLYNSGLEQY